VVAELAWGGWVETARCWGWVGSVRRGLVAMWLMGEDLANSDR
jgi:hypothetical protein